MDFAFTVAESEFGICLSLMYCKGERIRTENESMVSGRFT